MYDRYSLEGIGDMDRRDPASVIAAGHRAGIELIAQAAEVVHHQ